MKTILNGIKNENPIFVLMLGLCPALAVTTKFENAYLMGICVLFVLIFSSIIVSLLRGIIPENVRIPVYVLIVGTFVTAIEMLLGRYAKEIQGILGIYLPLIVVNCVVLGRCLSIYGKEKVGKSFLDAVGIGLGYTVALLIIAFFREVLGTNTITLMDKISVFTGYRAVYQILPFTSIFPISVLTTPAGAFLTIGVLLGIINHIGGDKNASH